MSRTTKPLWARLGTSKEEFDTLLRELMTAEGGSFAQRVADYFKIPLTASTSLVSRWKKKHGLSRPRAAAPSSVNGRWAEAEAVVSRYQKLLSEEAAHEEALAKIRAELENLKPVARAMDNVREAVQKVKGGVNP